MEATNFSKKLPSEHKLLIAKDNNLCYIFCIKTLTNLKNENYQAAYFAIENTSEIVFELIFTVSEFNDFLFTIFIMLKKLTCSLPTKIFIITRFVSFKTNMTMAHSIPQHGCHSKKDYNFLHAWKLPKVGWFEKIVQFFILVQLHFGWHGIRVPILGNLWGRNMRLIIRIYSSLLFHLGPLNHTFFPLSYWFFWSFV